jgi:UDP-N-acetylglucosamine--N-acetylmuramyl-(pentapeptide) pyrophosphoryl-undecaprenol N-acetylglucosamine transferase
MKEGATVFIAAGGTGGHIYPALSIAEEFKRQRPDLKIIFVGTPSGLENKLVPRKGFEVLHLPVGRLNQVSKFEKIKTLLKMPLVFFKCWQLIRKYRPALAIGVGGYASGPILLIAALLRVPTAIWEPNAMPGLTNRWLSRFVDECLLVFESAKAHLSAKKFLSVGMPVRREIEEATATPHPTLKKVLVFGGSQGARAINAAVAGMFKAHPELTLKWKIVHQTGPSDLARTKEIYGDLEQNPSIEVTDYLHDMDARYAWADVVISRAGAASLAELAACGKAAVLVPLPTAADDHQTKNADALVQGFAAIKIAQKDLTPEKLRTTLQELEENPTARAAMEANIRKFHRPKAAEKIVGHLLERVQ